MRYLFIYFCLRNLNFLFWGLKLTPNVVINQRPTSSCSTGQEEKLDRNLIGSVPQQTHDAAVYTSETCIITRAPFSFSGKWEILFLIRFV